MNPILKELIRKSRIVLKITISIGSILLLIFIIRVAGWSGVLAFILGMTFMAYLLLSKNKLLLGIVEYLDDKGEDYEKTNVTELLKK